MPRAQVEQGAGDEDDAQGAARQPGQGRARVGRARRDGGGGRRQSVGGPTAPRVVLGGARLPGDGLPAGRRPDEPAHEARHPAGARGPLLRGRGRVRHRGAARARLRAPRHQAGQSAPRPRRAPEAGRPGAGQVGLEQQAARQPPHRRPRAKAAALWRRRRRDRARRRCGVRAAAAAAAGAGGAPADAPRRGRARRHAERRRLAPPRAPRAEARGRRSRGDEQPDRGAAGGRGAARTVRRLRRRGGVGRLGRPARAARGLVEGAQAAHLDDVVDGGRSRRTARRPTRAQTQTQP